MKREESVVYNFCFLKLSTKTKQLFLYSVETRPASQHPTNRKSAVQTENLDGSHSNIKQIFQSDGVFLLENGKTF